MDKKLFSSASGEFLAETTFWFVHLPRTNIGSNPPKEIYTPLAAQLASENRNGLLTTNCIQSVLYLFCQRRGGGGGLNESYLFRVCRKGLEAIL